MNEERDGSVSSVWMLNHNEMHGKQNIKSHIRTRITRTYSKCTWKSQIIKTRKEKQQSFSKLNKSEQHSFGGHNFSILNLNEMNALHRSRNTFNQSIEIYNLFSSSINMGHWNWLLLDLRHIDVWYAQFSMGS